jgi:hypothetical protein
MMLKVIVRSVLMFFAENGAYACTNNPAYDRAFGASAKCRSQGCASTSTYKGSRSRTNTAVMRIMHIELWAIVSVIVAAAERTMLPGSMVLPRLLGMCRQASDEHDCQCCNTSDEQRYLVSGVDHTG